jgi:hypothetical protein
VDWKKFFKYLGIFTAVVFVCGVVVLTISSIVEYSPPGSKFYKPINEIALEILGQAFVFGTTASGLLSPIALALIGWFSTTDKADKFSAAWKGIAFSVLFTILMYGLQVGYLFSLMPFFEGTRCVDTCAIHLYVAVLIGAPIAYIVAAVTTLVLFIIARRREKKPI